MEPEQRRDNVCLTKSKQAGGKPVKSVTAEEEERRREVVKEKLRDKMDLEKKALTIVERLLDESVSEYFLSDCAKFITLHNYKDAIEERSIVHLCGYPICPNKLGKIPTQKFKISTKTNKVYDITERKYFCSNFCYKASKEFELQISNTPLWLRQHESLPGITFMKKGDGGSSGEEVMLSERYLEETDIENPLAAQSGSTHSSQHHSAAADFRHIESSDNEEQDFVSSVISQEQGPRVHWGDLPKRRDEDIKDEQGKIEKRKTQRRQNDEEKVTVYQSLNAERERKLREDENREESRSCKTGIEVDAEKSTQLLSLSTGIYRERVSEEEGFPKEPSVEEATSKLNLCSLSETLTHTGPLPVCSPDSSPTHLDLLTYPPCKDSKPVTESKYLPSPNLINTNQISHNTAQTCLKITQVGMSKRGAAGLRVLLRNHTAGANPDSVQLNLLQYLRKTLKDWRTEATVQFLFGSDHSLETPFTDVIEEKEEELDEDDLDDEVIGEDEVPVNAGGVEKPFAAVPDYDMIQSETKELELRVKEFYKGTWIRPEDTVTIQDHSTRDLLLPLVDSHAQHLIQKRITVEKLTSCFRNIIGHLHLTMNDISTDLNNLVRTFRFTNKNIIHKTPEWMLIAIVLLHLLSEVSPVVREALELPASVQYLHTLMKELGLQEENLLTLVRVLKTPTHS